MDINGKELALKIKNQIKEEVNTIKDKRKPQLVVILVGDNNASQVYVRNKEKACEYVGFNSQVLRYEDISEEDLLQLIDNLNKNNEVDGILVQLPLPEHIDSDKVLNRIDASKDVDGFHPENVAKLVLNEEGFLPCTPYGMMEMLKDIHYSLDGKHVVVVGRSNIVGKPVALLALHNDATVTIAHSHTKNLKEITRQADVLIAAIGKPKFFDDTYIKENTVVLDVGMNRDENNKLCGDCDYEKMKEKASYITPVPGGVGPMTIAMLLKNTLISYKRRIKDGI